MTTTIQTASLPTLKNAFTNPPTQIEAKTIKNLSNLTGIILC